MEMIDIRLDGLSASMPKDAGEKVTKALASRDEEIQALKDAADKDRARFDGMTKSLATAEKALEELPSKLREEIAGRARLEGHALKVLGADFNLDGRDDRAVRELVLQAIAKSDGDSELKLDGESDVYVRASFDIEMKKFRAPDATNKAMQAITGGPNPAVRQDASDEPDPVGAREAMIARKAARSKPATAAN